MNRITTRTINEATVFEKAPCTLNYGSDQFYSILLKDEQHFDIV